MPQKMFDSVAAAEYLHVSEEELSRLVKRGEIPFEKQGDRCIFRRMDIDAWASRHILGATSRKLEEYHLVSSRRAKARCDRHALVPEMFRKEFVTPELHAKTKSSVLREMVALAEKTTLLYDPADLLKSLEERESLCSTGMPGGWALLHPRHHEPYMFADSFILLARTPQRIAFGASDGERTDLFFLMCCQDDAIHLHTLARLCMMVQKTNVLDCLRGCTSADEMLKCLVQSEEAILPTARART